MSPFDEGFRKRLVMLFRAWQQGVATALREGQTRGEFAATRNPLRLLAF
jgi:hypothetical protein